MRRKSSNKPGKKTPERSIVPAAGRKIIAEGIRNGEVLYLVEWIPSYETEDMIENFPELSKDWKKRKVKLPEKKLRGWTTYRGVTEVGSDGEILKEDKEPRHQDDKKMEEEEKEEKKEEESHRGREEVGDQSRTIATVHHPKKGAKSSRHQSSKVRYPGDGEATHEDHHKHRDERNKQRRRDTKETSVWSAAALPEGVTQEMARMLTTIFDLLTKRDMSDLLSMPKNDHYYEYATKRSRNKARELNLGDRPIIALARILSQRDRGAVTMDDREFRDIWIRYTPDLNPYSSEQERIEGKEVSLLQVLNCFIMLEQRISMRNVFTSETVRKEQAEVCRAMIKHLPQLLNPGHFCALLWIRLFLSGAEILNLLQQLGIDMTSEWMTMAMRKLFADYKEENQEQAFDVAQTYTKLREHIRSRSGLASLQPDDDHEQSDGPANVEEGEVALEESDEREPDARGGEEDGDHTVESEEGSVVDDSPNGGTTDKIQDGKVLAEIGEHESRSIGKKRRMSDSEGDSTEEEAQQVPARKKGRNMT